MADDTLDLPGTVTTSPADLYFQSIGGGDLSVNPDPVLSFPYFDTTLETSGGHDGSTGDSTSIFNTLSGVAGSFLKAFTGSPTLTVGGATKPPATTATNSAMSSNMWGLAIGGVILLIVLVLVLGKR
jgi:hypothetical protein